MWLYDASISVQIEACGQREGDEQAVTHTLANVEAVSLPGCMAVITPIDRCEAKLPPYSPLSLVTFSPRSLEAEDTFATRWQSATLMSQTMWKRSRALLGWWPFLRGIETDRWLLGTHRASIANVLIYPLDLVASRMQTKTPQQKGAVHSKKRDAYADLPTALRTIYASNGGLAGFYAGIASDTLSTALSNFLYFYIYAALGTLAARHTARSGSKDAAAAARELVIGALAGVISRGFTTPLSTITVRKQTASKLTGNKESDVEKATNAAEDEEEQDSDYAPDSSLAIARDIYHEHGLTGFWRGYSSACALVSSEDDTRSAAY